MLRVRDRERTGSGAGRGSGGGAGGAVSTNGASSAGVGASKSPRISISAPSAVRIRPSSRAASREWPPREKKSSSGPTASARSTWAKRSHSAATVPLAAARPAGATPAPGSGRAARSSFPLGVSGSASSGTKTAGDQVVGQHAAGVLAQLRLPEALSGAAARHHVRGQLAVARRVLMGENRRPVDAGMPGQYALDLARLHPEAPDLHLAVGPSQVFEDSVRAPPSEVTGAVDALAGRGRDEAFGRQRGPPRYSRATPAPAA